MDDELFDSDGNSKLTTLALKIGSVDLELKGEQECEFTVYDYEYKTLIFGNVYSLKAGIKYTFSIVTDALDTSLYLRLVNYESREIILSPTTIKESETSRVFNYTPTEDIKVYVGYGTASERSVTEKIAWDGSAISRVTSCETKETELAEGIAENAETINSHETILNELGYSSVTKVLTWGDGYISSAGIVSKSSKSKFCQPFLLSKGEVVVVGTQNTNITIIGQTEDATEIAVGDSVTIVQKTSSIAQFETYSHKAEKDEYIVLSVAAGNYKVAFYKEEDNSISEDVSSLKASVTENTQNIATNTAQISSLANMSSMETDALAQRKYIEENTPYYLSAPTSPTSYDDDSVLETAIRRVPKEGKKFIYFADSHEQRLYSNNQEINIVPLLDYVKKRLGISKVVFGGDIIDAYKGDGSIPTYTGGQYQAAVGISMFASEYYSAFGNGLLWVEGNHDANSPGHENEKGEQDLDKDAPYLLSAKESYLRTTINNEGSVTFNDAAEFVEEQGLFTDKDLEEFKYWCKKTYYCDDIKNKIRYIVFETGNYGYTVRGCSAPASIWYQIDFIYNSLISTPDDYSIVVLGHQLGNGNETTVHPYYYPLSLLANIIYSYKHKTSYTFAPWSFGGNVTAYWKAKHGSETASVTYDFSSVTPKKIFALGGHYHFDDAFLAMPKDSSITGKITPPSSGVSDRDKSADYAEYEDAESFASDAVLIVWDNKSTYIPRKRTEIQELPHAKVWTMEEGTTTEYSFDVVTIQDDKVVFTRIGAGEDREFNL